MANDRVLRKIGRQEVPAEPEPGPEPVAGPRGHLPAAGHVKVTMNLRDEVWHGHEGTPGLRARAEDAGVPAVCIVEALVERYLSNPQFRRRIDHEALGVARDRKVTARRGRPAPGGVGPT